MKKFGLKCIAVILAVLMLTGMFYCACAAAETEIPDSAAAGGTVDYPCDETEAEPPAESREPFFCKEEDCIVWFDSIYITKGESVKMTAAGCGIDISEPDIAPVEGDIRFIPVKWRATQIDFGKTIDSGEWTEQKTVQREIVKTGKVVFETLEGLVDIRVEVDFIRQEYKNGTWETVGELTDSSRFTVETTSEATRNYLDELRRRAELLRLLILLPFERFKDFVVFLTHVDWSSVDWSRVFSLETVQSEIARFIRSVRTFIQFLRIVFEP
ncbi:MAG: hypothetical protein IKH13_09840 [Clostridia bacterium]|nr:hypothetical protein [Clostridia bacterium]